MKAAAVVLTVVLAACLINWVRSGASFHVVQALPLCGGYTPSLYDAATVAMLLLIPWGLGRLSSNGEDKD